MGGIKEAGSIRLLNRPHLLTERESFDEQASQPISTIHGS